MPIKKIIKRLVYGPFGTGLHFSQSGEDLNILAIAKSFIKINKGFYVDVGAFHPHIGSNTELLYRNGWRGINIDPRPGSSKLFNQYRPQDTNLEVGVGSSEGLLNYYYIGEDSALNSFSKETIEQNGALDQITKVIELPIIPLSVLLDKHLPAGKAPDLINIDTEGYEIEVLTSLDFSRHRPKIIAIEQNNVCTFREVMESETCLFLESKGFVPVGKNIIVEHVSTIIYVDRAFLGK